MKINEKKCNVCPRKCKANREEKEIGYCGETNEIRIAKTSLHQWEEPCITGKYGSGTVFFTGCNLKCIFCQNQSIAHHSIGKVVTEDELADCFLKLQENLATNINLVTAAHFVEPVGRAIKIAKREGLKIPIIYNSSAYETVESLRFLEGLIDVYLPDLKFMDAEVSKKYANASDYFLVAKAAIEEMFRQVGTASFSVQYGGKEEDKVMQRGVLVRHLILPGHTRDSMNLINYLHETYQNRIWISIMSQYTPVAEQKVHTNLNRRITKREYQKVLQYALDIGVEQAYIQEENVASDSFIPLFDCSFI